MVSPTSELPASDVAAFTDAELDQHLEENSGFVMVEDFENLPEEFIQRLRNRAQAGRDYVKSQPLQLDQLSARLLAKAIDRNTLSPSSRASTETVTSEDEYLERLKVERELYHALINDGGRPCYEISLLEDVASRPEEYREMLSVWRSNEDDWEVFGNQWQKWKEFRIHQKSVRGEDKFPTYIKVLKGCLARHGFTQTYQLDDDLFDSDPGRQNKLVTWIEYLNYEYWWYEQYAKFIHRHQRRYENAWNTLVNSKVLRPVETQEFLDNMDIFGRLQYKQERTDAEEALESAKSAAMAAWQALPDPQRSNLSQRGQEPRRRLAAAQSKLATAQESADWIKKRNRLISEYWGQTKDYRSAKDKENWYLIILQWMLRQIPLIELELGLNLFKAIENNSDSGNGRGKGLKHGRVEKGSKRTCHDANVDDEPRSKRLRHNVFSHHKTFGTDAGKGRRSVKTSELDNSRPKALRRSARIEAREKQSRCAIVSSSDAAKNAQMSLPPSTQGRKARSATTEPAKTGCPTRSDRRDASKPQGIRKKGRPRSRPINGDGANIP